METLTTNALQPLSQVALDVVIFLPLPSWCRDDRLVLPLVTINVSFNEGREPTHSVRL